MIVDDILLLIANDGWGTLYTTLFHGELPPAPDACIAVREYTGAEPTTFFGGSVANFVEYPRVQLLVRGAAQDYQTPRDRIERLYQGMIKRAAVTVNGTRYLAFNPVQSPFLYLKDENKRWTFLLNLDVWKDPATVSSTSTST